MVVENSNQCLCHRYAFSLSKAGRDEDLSKNFQYAIQCIAPDEFDKMHKFRYKEDTLASLVGRLFLRQVAKKMTGCSWDKIKFSRTDRGKPYLSSPPNTTFGMNISHQGDYVAFASSCTPNVGVDCMRLDIKRNNKTADEYITSMAKAASVEELKVMRGQPTDAMKMTTFYRFWCLKEAVLKATGQGIINNLDSIDFRVDPSERYRHGAFIKSTTVKIDDRKAYNWMFEESFIDQHHSVAVCYDSSPPSKCKFHQNDEAKIFFSKVDLDWLLQDATIINPLDDGGKQEYVEFMSKPKKTF
uniref:L-aminoadipate-semialdehyde dehydrogenase-phosphopantetheinyl transferase n=1 Tax=Rhabditophanes sp. KR3021 TaxID=114890 RepID=A0AC35TY07_9BILA